MKLSFVTTNPTIDILNWSGTEYYMAKSLEKYFDVDYITNIKTEVLTLASIRKIYLQYIRKEAYSITRSAEVAQAYAKQVKKRINNNTDVIFSASSLPLAYLKTDIPKVFYTDATFASIINYYDVASNLGSRTVKEGLALEKVALENCDLAIYSSDWAAQSAINDFGINENKVKVIPLGANISDAPSFDEVNIDIENRDRNICKIAFVGVDWIRKGGDIVFETVKRLNSIGLHTEMHIVGLKELPEEVMSSPFVVNHGFLNKNIEADLLRFKDIFKTSHFLFVPSKAEAFGLVFCEASAYGIPSISSKTGGIPTIIKDDINGRVFELGTDIEIFTQYIYEMFNDQIKYKALATSSYNEYKNRLNWDVAGEMMKNHIKNLL